MRSLYSARGDLAGNSLGCGTGRSRDWSHGPGTAAVAGPFRIRLVAFAAICGALVAADAVAQVQRSGGSSGAANAQLMMQYQQASTERAQLQSDNAKLKKDLEDLKKQLDAATKQAAASKAGVGRDAAQLATAQAANDRTSKDLADTKGKCRNSSASFARRSPRCAA